MGGLSNINIGQDPLHNRGKTLINDNNTNAAPVSTNIPHTQHNISQIHIQLSPYLISPFIIVTTIVIAFVVNMF